MSSGEVDHVGCGGHFRWALGIGNVCDKCGRHWDGKEPGVAVYCEGKHDPARKEGA